VGQNFLANAQRRNWHRANFRFDQSFRAHASPARGRATSEHERPTHTMILVIRKVGHTPKLGCAAGPQIIGCLDDLGHIGGHVFMVFFG